MNTQNKSKVFHTTLNLRINSQVKFTGLYALRDIKNITKSLLSQTTYQVKFLEDYAARSVINKDTMTLLYPIELSADAKLLGFPKGIAMFGEVQIDKKINNGQTLEGKIHSNYLTNYNDKGLISTIDNLRELRVNFEKIEKEEDIYSSEEKAIKEHIELVKQHIAFLESRRGTTDVNEEKLISTFKEILNKLIANLD